MLTASPYHNSQGHELNVKMSITKCSSKYRNKYETVFIVNVLSNITVSNFKSQRALDLQSCFVLSSESPLRVITTCFPLLKELSSELQVLIHGEGQVKRITPNTIP